MVSYGGVTANVTWRCNKEMTSGDRFDEDM